MNPQRKAFLPPPAVSRRAPTGSGRAERSSGGGTRGSAPPAEAPQCAARSGDPASVQREARPTRSPPPLPTQPALSAAPFLPPDWKTTLRGTSAHFGPIWMRGGGYLATGRRCSGSGVAIPGGTDRRVLPAAARSSPFASSLSGGSRKKKRLEQTEAPARLRARSRSARAPDARVRGPRIRHGFFFFARPRSQLINQSID